RVFEPGLIEESAQSVRVRHPEQHRRGVGHVLEAELGFVRLLLGILALRDVAHNRRGCEHLARSAVDRYVTSLDEAPPSGHRNPEESILRSREASDESLGQSAVLAAFAQ